MNIRPEAEFVQRPGGAPPGGARPRVGGLRVVVRRERACPKVLCDFCGLVIADARHGNYQWQHGVGEVFYTHKHCCDPFEKERGGDWCAMELVLLPHYLGNNLRINRKEALHLAGLFAQL
jgi:hypothetical protein